MIAACDGVDKGNFDVFYPIRYSRELSWLVNPGTSVGGQWDARQLVVRREEREKYRFIQMKIRNCMKSGQLVQVIHKQSWQDCETVLSTLRGWKFNTYSIVRGWVCGGVKKGMIGMIAFLIKLVENGSSTIDEAGKCVTTITILSTSEITLSLSALLKNLFLPYCKGYSRFNIPNNGKQ